MHIHSIPQKTHTPFFFKRPPALPAPPFFIKTPHYPHPFFKYHKDEAIEVVLTGNHPTLLSSSSLLIHHHTIGEDMNHNNSSYENKRRRVYESWGGTTFEYFQRLDSFIVSRRNPAQLDIDFQQNFRNAFRYVHGQTNGDQFMLLNMGITTTSVLETFLTIENNEDNTIRSMPAGLEKQQMRNIIKKRQKRMKDQDEQLLSPQRINRRRESQRDQVNASQRERDRLQRENPEIREQENASQRERHRLQRENPDIREQENDFQRQRNRVRRLLKVEILNGTHQGDIAFIPRIDLRTTQGFLPFVLKRRQFPVKVAFAMTINKAQGQSLLWTGIWLPEPVFAHGQLYVALSRSGDPDKTKLLINNVPGKQGQFDGHEGYYTANIVYQEVLQLHTANN